MLATDYVLQGAVELLEKVRDGQLRLDRTIEVSVTNTTEKKRILKRIGPNLVTLRHLLKQNNQRLPHRRQQAATPCRERRAAWRRLIRRRNKAVRLVEEMNLRNNRLQPLFDKLADIAHADGDAARSRFAKPRSRGLSPAAPSRSCAASCAT